MPSLQVVSMYFEGNFGPFKHLSKLNFMPSSYLMGMSLCSPKEHWGSGSLSHTNSAESSDVGLGGSHLGSVEKLPEINLWNALAFVMETALYFPKFSQSLLWFLQGHNDFTEPSLESSEQGLAFLPKAICVSDRPCAEAKSSSASPCVPCWLKGDFSCSMKPRTPAGNWAWAVWMCPCQHLASDRSPFLCPRASLPQGRKHLGDPDSLLCEF